MFTINTMFTTRYVYYTKQLGLLSEIGGVPQATVQQNLPRALMTLLIAALLHTLNRQLIGPLLTYLQCWSL